MYAHLLITVQIRGSALIEPKGLLEANEDGLTTLLISNSGKSTCQIKCGTEMTQDCRVNLEWLDSSS